MKAILAALLMTTLVLSWSPVTAQETPAEAETLEIQNPTPKLTEAEQKARTEKLQALQLQVDNCNTTLMGMPVEHKACIQKIMESLNPPAPADDAADGSVNAEARND